MSDCEMKWCPLSKDKCRDDCAWANIAYDMNDDGITKYTNCSVLLIAASLLNYDIIIED